MGFQSFLRDEAKCGLRSLCSRQARQFVHLEHHSQPEIHVRPRAGMAPRAGVQARRPHEHTEMELRGLPREVGARVPDPKMKSVVAMEPLDQVRASEIASAPLAAPYSLLGFPRTSPPRMDAIA
jgi:hypothetical protein